MEPMPRQIQIVDYDPRWPGWFRRESDRVQAALVGRNLLLEHVGSTAVPGLAAKPVIDVLLEVTDSDDEDSFVPALQAVGYVLRVREPQWHRHRMFKGPDTAVNLHVFPTGCAEIARMRAFRDWLRANAIDRELYAQTKLALAGQDWDCVDDYARAKTEVVFQILGRAADGKAQQFADSCEASKT